MLHETLILFVSTPCLKPQKLKVVVPYPDHCPTDGAGGGGNSMGGVPLGDVGFSSFFFVKGMI